MNNPIDDKEFKKSTVIEAFKLAADCIAQTFGPLCEVVVLDMETADHSTVKVINGHISGQRVGAALSDYHKQLAEPGRSMSVLFNDPRVTADGRQIESSTVV